MCAFCEAMEHNKKLDEISNGIKEEYLPKRYYEYTVAIVRRSWTKERGKRHAGRVTDYRNQGIGYQLNYCPECGRKLKV